MYCTITMLEASSEEDGTAIVAGLERLLDELAGVQGLVQAHLVASEVELVLVTLYGSLDEAETLSADVRPRLASIVGPHLASPPRRWSGPVVSSLR
jgi:hypothetical protein